MISLPTKLDRKHLLIMSYTLIAFVIGLAVRWVTDNLLKQKHARSETVSPFIIWSKLTYR